MYRAFRLRLDLRDREVLEVLSGVQLHSANVADTWLSVHVPA
jgi:hypothetical protein